MLPIVLAVAGLAIAYTFTGENLISSKQAKKMILTGRIKRVIDVRTYMEYNIGHYPRAIHLPINRMNKKSTAGLPRKGLLVYCNSGQRARAAAEKLIKLGFKDVYYIAGHYSTLL
jgi:rhodanese-related sulfurtransferase